MREIKFRAWHKRNKEFYNWGIGNIDDNGGLGTFPSDLGYLDHQEYTGLLDKNGVEIYEGDIVSIMDCEPSIYKICYWEQNFKWGVEYIGSDITNWQEENLEEFNSECFEVIGNIYENPELLESP